MEIELKTKYIQEIVNKCKSMNLDLKDVKLETKIFEDIRYPDEYYVKLFLIY